MVVERTIESSTKNTRLPSSTSRSGVYLTEALVCLLYTSDAADERSSVDLGGRRIIKKKKTTDNGGRRLGKQ